MSHDGAAKRVVGRALDGLRPQRLIHSAGSLPGMNGSLPTDRPEVAQLLADPAFAAKLSSLADTLGQSGADTRAEAAAYLREMSATHSERTGAAFRRFSQWLARAHDVYVDELDRPAPRAGSPALAAVPLLAPLLPRRGAGARGPAAAEGRGPGALPGARAVTGPSGVLSEAVHFGGSLRRTLSPPPARPSPLLRERRGTAVRFETMECGLAELKATAKLARAPSTTRTSRRCSAGCGSITSGTA